MRSAVLRIIAMLLLLTGVTDFLSFDRTDLFESMSAAGQVTGKARAISHMRHAPPAGMTPTALPDDGCIFCGLGLPAVSGTLQFSPLFARFQSRDVSTARSLLLDSPHLPPKAFLS